MNEHYSDGSYPSGSQWASQLGAKASSLLQNRMAQDQYALQTKVPGVKQATLTEQVGQAHDLVETLQNLLTGLETRLAPILSFPQLEGQKSEAPVCVEPPLIDETGRLILRLRSLANRVEDIERRVRI